MGDRGTRVVQFFSTRLGSTVEILHNKTRGIVGHNNSAGHPGTFEKKHGVRGVKAVDPIRRIRVIPRDLSLPPFLVVWSHSTAIKIAINSNYSKQQLSLISKTTMRGINKRRRHIKATREIKKQRRMERYLAPLPLPASEPAAPPEAGYYLEELEEEGESLTARAEVHWDEASTDGEESEEGLEMTEGEDNVELSGNSGRYCAMTGNIAPLIDE